MAIAIGDIHGCLSTLQRLVQRLPHNRHLVFLGDYIDRGPDSSAVISYLKTLDTLRPCTFLMGNHEKMMLRATKHTQSINQWLLNGGIATLTSYGISTTAWKKAENRAEFLNGHLEFFKKLKPYHEMDGHIFVHAGVDKSIEDMKQQKEETLFWIREKFFGSRKKWPGDPIVFGHTPTRLMGLTGKKIFKAENLYGIDTGCVYGGYLTAFDTETSELIQEKSDFRPER